MKNTTYKNPEGLTEAGPHHHRARPRRSLATRLMQRLSRVRAATTRSRSTVIPGTPSTNDTNRNLLLFRDPTVDGLKTGHTQAAGYCHDRQPHKRDFPNLTPGRPAPGVDRARRTASENARANESQKLLNWGYTAFDAVQTLRRQPGSGHAARFGRAAESTVKLGRPEWPSWSRFRPAQPGKIKTQVVRPDPLVAPFTKFQADRRAEGHAGQ